MKVRLCILLVFWYNVRCDRYDLHVGREGLPKWRVLDSFNSPTRPRTREFCPSSVRGVQMQCELTLFVNSLCILCER